MPRLIKLGATQKDEKAKYFSRGGFWDRRHFGDSGAILLFVSAQCPTVKQYNERISQFAADFEAKGINVIGINSNSTESLEWIKSHAAENYKFPVLIDKGNVIADKLGAN